MQPTFFSNFRKTMPRLLAFIFATISLFAHAEAPKVFWNSQPVRPNETVMVQGHAITTVTNIEALRLVDAYPGSPLPAIAPQFDDTPQPIPPLSFGESIINFAIPKDWLNGVYAYRLLNNVPGAVQLVNAPDPWFIHGDQGSRATPGGWVAVYGNSLTLGSQAPQPPLTPQLALTKNGLVVKQIAARPGSDNAYAQYFDLPADLLVGSYELYVHNGYGGPAAWMRFPGSEVSGSSLLKIVSRSDLWETAARAQPEIVINAANGNGGAANWDAVFANAIATVNARPSRVGGVIRVKQGVYNLHKYLVLPDHIILAGEFGKKDTTIMQWGGGVDPAGRNPLVMGAVLRGFPVLTRATFSIEDLTLARTSQNRAGVCIERAYTNIEEQSAWFRRIVCREPNTAEAAVAAFARGTDYWGTTRPAIYMDNTKNTEITDSTLDMLSEIYLARNNDFLRIENNLLRWRLLPLRAHGGLRNFIYAGNTELMLGTESGNGFPEIYDVGNDIGSFSSNQRDIYYGKNHMVRDAGGTPRKSLGFTLDGNAGVYFGKIAAVAGTRIELARKTSLPYHPNANYFPRAQRGAMVQILSGKGAGQWRHLVSPILDRKNEGVTTVNIDRPWEVDPNKSSWLSISDFQGRLIFHRNDLSNAPLLQIYYASHDVIVAENKLSDTQLTSLSIWNGFRGGYGSMTRGWHTQILDNIIGAGGVAMNSTITSLDRSEILVSGLGSYSGYNGSYTSTQILRNNINTSSPIFQISPADQNSGFLVENNIGVSWFIFNEPPFKEEIGLLRNNTSVSGNRPQLLERSGYRYPTNPGPDVKLSYSNGNVVNLARSGLATAANDSSSFARVKPIDGETGSGWVASKGLAASGVANQAWLQVDLRTSDVIQSVKIWPRLDVNNETADVWVLVSPTPFLSNDLDTELARPGVFSRFIAGKFTGVTTVALPTELLYTQQPPASGDPNISVGTWKILLLNPQNNHSGYVGRYVRVWKKFPGNTTGQLQLSEIEVMGCNVTKYQEKALACPVF